jgi:hypothetical protein
VAVESALIAFKTSKSLRKGCCARLRGLNFLLLTTPSWLRPERNRLHLEFCQKFILRVSEQLRNGAQGSGDYAGYVLAINHRVTHLRSRDDEANSLPLRSFDFHMLLGITFGAA